jgi:hypothetical protein
VNDTPLYHLPSSIETRWASAENYDALPGESAKANFGRKGSACRGDVQPGDVIVMAHAEGSGTVRRIWVTISDQPFELLRGLVIRIYWDGEEKPAVEAPLGDFFCVALGRHPVFQNAWFDNPEGRSFNFRIPMPFRKGFKMTVTNESPKRFDMFFYDVNFTIGEEHGPDVGYFHAYFNHENPTTLRQDYTILPKVEGRGRFLGCNQGVVADTAKYGPSWWGEGEVKMYLDGDTDFPTLCGTGTEDYIATGWGLGQYANLWHGCPVADGERNQYCFYRLHGPDPVYFHKELRVVIQQLGCPPSKKDVIEFMKKSGVDKWMVGGDGTGWYTLESLENDGPLGLFEREDDWCSTAYFYLDRPSSSLPAIEPYEARIANLTGEPEKK